MTSRFLFFSILFVTIFVGFPSTLMAGETVRCNNPSGDTCPAVSTITALTKGYIVEMCNQFESDKARLEAEIEELEKIAEALESGDPEAIAAASREIAKDLAAIEVAFDLSIDGATTRLNRCLGDNAFPDGFQP